ncbi:MAG: hypothetical protein H6754_08770 [Candidatus Omnitrophica bacterium]|nr:hypothetical protein [Candidatus Omnitrophota bacterium]
MILLTTLLFVGVSFYLHKNGKSLIEDTLSSALQKEVNVGKARIMFPLGLRFDNIKIKDALTAKALRVNLGVPIFFGGHFNIAKIKLTDPVFFITYSADRKIIWGKADTVAVLPSDSTSDQPVRASGGVKKTTTSKGIVIDYLEVKNGVVRFFDQVHNSQIDVGQINLKAIEIAFPKRNMKTRFDLTAMVLSEDAPFAGQKVEAKGMINVAAHNMDASIIMADPKGNAGFKAHLKSVNNDMLVKGRINVGRFVAGIRTPGSKESSFEGFLANALESSGVEIGVDFTCETKMDDFNCDKLGMSGNVIQTEKKL